MGIVYFRNDGRASQNTRPYGVTAVFCRTPFLLPYPYCATQIPTLPDVTVVAIYRAQVRQLRVLLMETLQQCFTPFNNYIG